MDLEDDISCCEWRVGVGLGGVGWSWVLVGVDEGGLGFDGGEWWFLC